MGNGFQPRDSLRLALAETTNPSQPRRPAFRRFLGRVAGSFPFCLLLFLLTIMTTLVVGVHMSQNYAAHLPIFDIDMSWAFFSNILRHLAMLWTGAPYALTALAILLAHELGHYFTCRYYHIDATYPYFIPAPTVVGTWGAFIQIRSPLVTRQELFDVGISGPIAGFVVAIPMLLMAAWQAGSRVAPIPGNMLVIGHPLAISLLAKLFHPGIRISQLALTPVGGAVWVGLLVTALNLLPMGQLDGGHIFYAVFGPAHRYASLCFFIALIPMGYFFWPGWWVWAVLMIFIGLRHPAPVIDDLPLDRRRKLIAVAALAMLILCFTFTPFNVT